MAFSGALTLSDLNDFITPSQACIKPVEEVKPEEDIAEPGAAATQIRVDSTGNYFEVGNTKANGSSGGRKLQQAEISLNDCLACSGCITSAESVLISMQSHEEVLSFLSSNPPSTSPEHHIPVLSISPQSLASLAASASSTSTHPVSPETILHRVRAFCHQALGIPHVFDTTFARHISLLEQGREFQERKAAHSPDNVQLPMLASACPGWVCYAEKAHAEMLPFISQTKSPQQIMGSLVKEWMGKKWGKQPDQIYHVSVMPCYDKKLEASRQDFYNDVYKTRDVDCVITTGELELLMREKGWDLSTRVENQDASKALNGDSQDIFPEIVSHPGTSSGSYLHSLIALISNLAENKNRALELTSRIIRSADYEEFILKDTTTEEIVFKGAKCYGFRNLQNVVRKVGKENGIRGLPGGAVRGRARRRAAEGQTISQDKGYDFVEVMACPSGCVNGGGQIKPPRKVLEERNMDVEGYPRQWEAEGAKVDDMTIPGAMADPAAKWGNKDWTKKVEDAYWSSKAKTSTSEADVFAGRILKDLCSPQMPLGGVEGSWMWNMDDEAEGRRHQMFRTNYKKVESEVVGIAVKW
ncbi:hypothetical protein M422DRAFT_49427 [Sphaerobolus stellatus SS14]|uniref:Iron hydrogenase large subunit C-terminal domain-containing protein n=1 Tax=Sphaerobolus stellatus (strain SS14) TaxID=990650 RepID=A0A0C9UYJ5_SPHS4|nr:hypothetical protein M422DRAFT_49427 [Sphaerobolus stellatus SS14]